MPPIINSPLSVICVELDAEACSFPSTYNLNVLDSLTITARCQLLSAKFVVPVKLVTVPSPLPAKTLKYPDVANCCKEKPFPSPGIVNLPPNPTRPC